MSLGRRLGWFLLALGGCTAPSAPATEVRLELAGGNNPGAYTARQVQQGCSRDPIGPGSWAIQLSDWTGPKEGLRSLQLVVPAPEHGNEFYLGLVFGDFFAGTVREIETRPTALRRLGRGAVKVEPSIRGAVITVTGVTQDSVALTATIACRIRQPNEGGTQ